MAAPYVDQYIGMPSYTKSDENPYYLRGSWLDKSSYSIKINIENPQDANAVITINKEARFYPVKLKFPTEDRQLLKNQLKYNHTSFVVVYQKKGKTEKVYLYSNVMGKIPPKNKTEKKVKIVRLHIDESIFKGKSQDESKHLILQLIKTISPNPISDEKVEVSLLAILCQMNKLDLGPESYTVEKIKIIQNALDSSKSNLREKMQMIGKKRADEITTKMKQEFSEAFEVFARQIQGLFLEDRALNECTELFMEAEQIQKWF